MARAMHVGHSQLRAKRRMQRRFIAISIFLGLLIVLTIVLWIFHQPYLRISRINATGASTIGSTTIATFAEQELSGDYLYVLPKNNIFLYSKDALAAALLAKFPALKSVEVSADNFQTITIEAMERKPMAMWCGETPDAPVDCLLLDETGLAYAPSPAYSGNAYIRYFGSLASTTPRQYLSSERLSALSALIGAIEKKIETDSVESVWVDEHSDVRAVFRSGFTLLFAGNEESGVVFERFVLALSADPFLNHRVSEFEYLDVRFGDKLYYKHKGE